MSHQQSRKSTSHLRRQQAHGQTIFPHRSKPNKPEIENGKVRASYNVAGFGIKLDADQFQSMKQFKCSLHRFPQWLRVLRSLLGRFRAISKVGNRRLQQAASCIEVWQTMTRTRDQAEQLRSGVDEVEDLWHE